MADYPPTEEQTKALELARGGGNVVIEALAGSGKTVTCKMLAVDAKARNQRTVYTAFNRAIVDEAKATFPNPDGCRTMHSLAFRDYGSRFKHRFNSRRQSSVEIAQILGLTDVTIFFTDEREGSKTFPSGFAAGVAMNTVRRFCQTADPEITERHIARIEGLDAPGHWEHHHQFFAEIRNAVHKAWADWTNVQGVLRYDHAAYLKMAQLNGLRIAGDIIIVDEAQDIAPVFGDIVFNQNGDKQIVAVGDSNQELYAWTGAVNAMANIEGGQRTWLSRSFRFGQDIADVAQVMLDRLDCPVQIIGAGPTGSVGTVDAPDAILSRTNAGAVWNALDQLRIGGRTVGVMGGVDDVIRFAEAARTLQAGGQTFHPELACFDTWDAVEHYAATDQLGGDLKMLVKLVNEFGPSEIVMGLSSCVKPETADVVTTTGHKVKGMGWPKVRVGEDFSTDPGRTDDMLMYVAVTRAKVGLDIDAAVESIWPEDAKGGERSDSAALPSTAPVGESAMGSPTGTRETVTITRTDVTAVAALPAAPATEPAEAAVTPADVPVLSSDGDGRDVANENTVINGTASGHVAPEPVDLYGDAITVPCPRCGAGPGVKCEVATRDRRSPHPGRKATADA